MSFNSNPANVAKVKAEASNFPTFNYYDGYVRPSANAATLAVYSNVVGGFSSDPGSYITLPSAYSNTFYYTDSAGNASTSGVWLSGLSPTEVASTLAISVDGWTGFYMSDDGNTLYMLCMTNATKELHLVTVDSAGTLSLVWSSAYTVDSTGMRWPTSTILRNAKGGGNLFIRYNEGVATQESEFNFSTGAVIAENTRIAAMGGLFWKTENGVYITIIGGYPATSSSNSSASVLGVSGPKGATHVAVPWEYRPPGTGFSRPLTWKGHVLLASNVASIEYNGRALTFTELNRIGDELARIAGVLI